MMTERRTLAGVQFTSKTPGYVGIELMQGNVMYFGLATILCPHCGRHSAVQPEQGDVAQSLQERCCSMGKHMETYPITVARSSYCAADLRKRAKVASTISIGMRMMTTYRGIQIFVRSRHGVVAQSCWIAHVKELNVQRFAVRQD
ncbi:hypothetical protein PI87_26945 [Ralstonia sp. A12]|uniref:hypothetical protein n=1 Tax=Ralstonia sp. A12 TaxID=1217052 RepID=UPI000574C597|nr:hypothetical protein [Ralstonia sp. A12]KHK49107.1 hypothetical protein PI87_26945 [Ralstonia sp. A12]